MPTQPRHDQPEALNEIAEAIAREHGATLARIARVRGARVEEVDEAVSQAFAQLLRFYTGELATRAVFRYLIACLETSVYKQRRTTRRREAWLSSERDPDGARLDSGETHSRLEQVDPLERAIEREETKRCRALLAELPPDQRAIVLLSAAGYGQREIAARLGFSHRQVRKRVTKANARLRELRARV